MLVFIGTMASSYAIAWLTIVLARHAHRGLAGFVVAMALLAWLALVGPRLLDAQRRLEEHVRDRLRERALRLASADIPPEQRRSDT